MVSRLLKELGYSLQANRKRLEGRAASGYLRTAQTPAGSPADPLYMEQIPTSALLADALTAYNSGHWEDALGLYKTAVGRKDGQQLRTFNGIYLTETRLGHTKEAEEAFGRIAALGIATKTSRCVIRPVSPARPESAVSAIART